MLQLSTIREEKERVIQGLAKRNLEAAPLLEEVTTKDDERRATQSALDSNLATANQLAKEIGELYKSGKRAEADAKKAETAELKEEAKRLSDRLKEIEDELHRLLTQIPNVPYHMVAPGKTPEDNVEVRSWGKLPTLHMDAKPHWDLAKEYDIIDFELGNKITGAGFPVYKGQGARLQRALINFFLDINTAAGYQEVQPPHLVNEDSGFGTGQLPDKEGQMYHVGIDNLYLIPTAEVPVTNLYRDVILEELPVKATAYTPCFRREAGSYGKHVRGLNRLHQFDKVEIVQIQHPDHSYAALEEMVLHVEGILQKLELPYRILRLCGGDMGFTSAMTYDFEVWSAAQERWLEVSSVSNFETFQANRLKLRYRDENRKTQLAHTLNGSAMALPRIVAALLENFQAENSIRIPKALQAYTHFDAIVKL
jgi:seryl-tRNA synthetase